MQASHSIQKYEASHPIEMCNAANTNNIKNNADKNVDML